MNPGGFFAELKRRNVYKVAVYAVVAWLLTQSSEISASLAGRSNEELLAIIRAGEKTSNTSKYEIKPLVLPPKFWSMPARDAALALVLENCSEETKRRVAFSLAEPAKDQPPEKGEVGIRWKGTGSGPMAGGLTILYAAGEKSHLAYSAVELAGEATQKQIKSAIDRTKTLPLAPDVARRAFQVVWWLGRVRQTGEAGTQSIFVNHQTAGTFWIKPGLPARRDVTLLGWPLGPETGEKFDAERHAGFAEFVISEAVKQQPQKIESVTAILGEGVYPDEGLKFLRTQSRPRSDEETAVWVTDTLKILRDPRYRSWRSIAMSNLVPWQEPMRYRDPSIDAALQAVADEELLKAVDASKHRDEWSFDGAHAVERLAWRDRTDIFSALIAALRAGQKDYKTEYLLSAAALLASRHSELRPPMLEYLREQLTNLGSSKLASWKLFDTVWRFDFRELQSPLEQLATTNANEMEDDLGTAQISPPQPAPRRFHAARKILLSWSEPNPLTKLKLDGLLEASSAASFQPAEHLKRQFDQLREPEQQAFREFVAWMKGQELAYNWSPRRVDWAISPEALAAAE